MLDTTEFLVFIGLGLVFAAGVVALGRWFNADGPRLGAYALIAVAFLYVGFAVRAENPETWVGFEMTGVAVFGSLAGLTIVGAPWGALAGLALHPIYAYYFHFSGAGQEFAPPTFVVTTMAFDVAMALFVAFAIWRQTRAAPNAPAAPTPKLAARSQNRKKGV